MGPDEAPTVLSGRYTLNECLWACAHLLLYILIFLVVLALLLGPIALCILEKTNMNIKPLN